MSFSFGDAVPLARPPLDYAALLAKLNSGRNRHADAPPAAPCPLETRMRALPASLRLATVILGRPGWREAARALGGCFLPVSRKPL